MHFKIIQFTLHSTKNKKRVPLGLNFSSPLHNSPSAAHHRRPPLTAAVRAHYCGRCFIALYQKHKNAGLNFSSPLHNSLSAAHPRRPPLITSVRCFIARHCLLRSPSHPFAFSIPLTTHHSPLTTVYTKEFQAPFHSLLTVAAFDFLLPLRQQEKIGKREIDAAKCQTVSLICLDVAKCQTG